MPDRAPYNCAANSTSRVFVVGSELEPACSIIGYRLTECSSRENHCKISESDGLWRCPLHGNKCMGHLETDKNNTCALLPSTLTPKIQDMKNPYQRHKDDLNRGSITYESYRKCVSRMMMGKKGAIRSMASIRVEGTVKMVISMSKRKMKISLYIQMSTDLLR